MPAANDPTRSATHPTSTQADPSAATDATSVQRGRPAPPGAAVLVIPGYELRHELARGGMGVVYAATDTTFGREVAVKTLLPGASAERFVVEAGITGRLTHPGIPPVHHLGTLPDGRPFLVMKLIRGNTLSHLLKERASVGDVLRFVPILESVSQAVGFAHARGIIHRDIKPSNVMVGAFGEVQVMDWGLAKLVGAEEREHFAAPQRGAPDETRAGRAMGTPAYMAPEQARGEWNKVDARADVFALGGILCSVLTGEPPFTGTTAVERTLKAAEADTADALGRLDACGADPELIALAKRCLGARPDDRPTDGKAVADALAAYRNGVAARLQEAETDRAAAEARAEEEANTRREAERATAEQRRKRLWQLAACAIVVLAGVGGGAVAWRQSAKDHALALKQERDETDRKATETRLAGEQQVKAEQARAGLKLATALRKQFKFRDAGDALKQAAELAGGAPDLVAEVSRARRDLDLVLRLDDIRYRKWVWFPDETGGNFNTRIAPPEYRKAFADHDLAIDARDAPALARTVGASAVKADLLAALDDWALYEPDDAARNKLLEVARLADPDPWTDRLRDPNVRDNKPALARLATEALATASPAALVVLAELMERRQLDPTALLRSGRAAHPNNFDLAFNLGLTLQPARLSRAGPGEIARALLPEQLGAYEVAHALRPDNIAVLLNLGNVRNAVGDVTGAHALYDAALRIDPTCALTHTSRGAALKEAGDVPGAIAAHREAIRLDPGRAVAHYNLGGAIHASGDLPGARAAYREAIRLDPNYAQAHNNLGNVLRALGDPRGALAAHRKAVQIDKEYALGHYNLGLTLQDTGDVPGAIAAFKESIRLDPKPARSHFNLGVALQNAGDFPGALAAYKEATRLDPKHVKAHNNQGAVHLELKNYPAAVACARAALGVNPEHSTAFAVLTLAFQGQGDLSSARAAAAEAARLNPKEYGGLPGMLPPVPVAPAPRPK